MNVYQNSDFFKFLDLCGIVICENTNIAAVIEDFNNFNKYRMVNVDNSFEHNFIKWQINRRGPHPVPKLNPQPKILQPDHTTTPVKLQALKDTTADIGDFFSYTFTSSPQPQVQLPVESPTKAAVDNLVSQYLSP